MPHIKSLTLLLLAVAATSALGQTPTRREAKPVELGLSYTYLRSNILPGCNCVSLNGGSAELVVPFASHFAAVADFTLVHRGNVTPDRYALTQLTYTFGVRSFLGKTSTSVRPFVEALAGGAHVSGSLAPASTGTGPSNNSIVLQLGGGITWRLPHHFTLRPIQADYVMTTLSNNAADRQNDLRLSTGINYRFTH